MMGLLGSTCMKYFTVGIMTAINLLNYMDRYTIAGAALCLVAACPCSVTGFVCVCCLRHFEGAGLPPYQWLSQASG